MVPTTLVLDDADGDEQPALPPRGEWIWDEETGALYRVDEG